MERAGRGDRAELLPRRSGRELCTTTPRTPRTRPVNVTLVPGATAGFGEGGRSERTPTLNQVERRPSADLIADPPTLAASCEPCESDVTLSVFTRRDELRFTVASTTRPTTPTALPSVFPVTGTWSPGRGRGRSCRRDRGPRRDTACPRCRTRRPRFRPAAGAGGEQRVGHVAVVEEYLAGRLVHGPLPGRRLGRDAEIGLADPAGVDVERRADPSAREGKGAGGDGLRLKRGREPGGRHLRRNDPRGATAAAPGR